MTTRALAYIVMFSVFTIALALWMFSESRQDSTVSLRSDFDSGKCDPSAVLLEEEVTVLDEPNGRNLAMLESGQVIYLCETTSDHRRIVYPSNGTPADCSQRNNDFCSAGYVREPFQIMLLG